MILGLLGILFIGGCAVIIGGLASSVDESLEQEAENDRPTDVTEGEAFSHDGFEVADGWTVGSEFNSVTLEGVRVTAAEEDPDLPDSGRTALLTFRFYKGTEVLAEVECTTNEMQVGESSRADCFNLGQGRARGYDRIAVSDLF